ncbi:DCL family protein [Okeanomitos corallinicola TIOX110]|uniref:DCL family protein n=1 Tax=Okeanomitos corallinicola TIOX110 TaxID=3133117 RepID=A0ABZ2USB7_9CYAN
MAKPVTIGNITFSSHESAKKYIQAIVSHYDQGSRLENNDFIFVSDLLLLHPESDQKIASGIKAIFVDLDAQYHKNKCFYIERMDGSITDFSWISCIKGRNIRKEIFDAFRNAVTDQIKEFRISILKNDVICPYSNEKLNHKNSHVDHVQPLTFYTLVLKFLESESISLVDVKISEPEDNQFTAVLIDLEFKKKWQNYHKENAQLRLISQSANLSEAKKL